MSMVSGIQGQLLEITVVGCSRLKDTEWISRQDPYVCLEYATTKFRTRTCTDGGKHPIFQEKTVIPLIEGLHEITVSVWNSNTLTFDDFIGTGRVQLQKVLSHGYDDSSWTLQSKSGKYAGEVKLILHFPNAHNSHHIPSAYAPAASMYMNTAAAAPYPVPLGYPTSKSGAEPHASYPPPGEAYPSWKSAAVSYPPVEAYPPAAAPTMPSYPPAAAGHPAHDAYAQFPGTTYPAHGSQYPPPQQPYPPPMYPPQAYPPPQQAHQYYPTGAYPGVYPPPPY